MAVDFSGSAIVWYVSAENQKRENYSIQVERANNPDISQDEKVDYYINAIKIDPTKTEAYLKLIEMFISGDKEKEILRKSEAATIIQLKAGVEKRNVTGFLETVYPFEELKKKKILQSTKEFQN